MSSILYLWTVIFKVSTKSTITFWFSHDNFCQFLRRIYLGVLIDWSLLFWKWQKNFSKEKEKKWHEKEKNTERKEERKKFRMKERKKSRKRMKERKDRKGGSLLQVQDLGNWFYWKYKVKYSWSGQLGCHSKIKGKNNDWPFCSKNKTRFSNNLAAV